jgi:hypothetical protein
MKGSAVGRPFSFLLDSASTDAAGEELRTKIRDSTPANLSR